MEGLLCLPYVNVLALLTLTLYSIYNIILLVSGHFIFRMNKSLFKGVSRFKVDRDLVAAEDPLYLFGESLEIRHRNSHTSGLRGCRLSLRVLILALGG